MKRASLLFALAVAACSTADDRGACKPSETCVRAGIASDPGSLDPARAFIKQDQTLILDLLTGLTTFDSRGRIVPGLAQEWSVSPDGLTWRFTLRAARWSDGTAITSHDVLYSVRRLLDPKTAATYATLLYPLRNAEAVHQGRAPLDALGIEAPDARTVVLRLAHPTPYLPSLLAHYGLAPVPAHVVDRWGESWTTPGRYVSSGAFVLQGWRLADRLTLTRNPRFYDAANVCLDRVEYFPTPDVVQAERRVRRGELDWHPSYDSARRKFLTGPGGLPRFVHTAPFPDVIYIAFNMRHRALRDLRVRQAIAMAIDTDFIALKILGGGQQPTASFVPGEFGGSPAAPPWAKLDFASRQTLARKLLADAGWSKRRPLVLELKSTPGAGLLPTAAAADLRAVGVNVRLARNDVAVFFNDLQLGNFELGWTDWIADYPDATNFLNLLRTDNPANYGNYRDAAYDAMLARAEREPDIDRRAALLQRAEERMLQAAPVAPLFTNPSRNLVDPRLTGWHDNLDDVHPSRYICRKGQAPRTQ